MNFSFRVEIWRPTDSPEEAAGGRGERSGWMVENSEALWSELPAPAEGGVDGRGVGASQHAEGSSSCWEEKTCCSFCSFHETPVKLQQADLLDHILLFNHLNIRWVFWFLTLSVLNYLNEKHFFLMISRSLLNLSCVNRNTLNCFVLFGKILSHLVSYFKMEK